MSERSGGVVGGPRCGGGVSPALRVASVLLLVLVAAQRATPPSAIDPAAVKKHFTDRAAAMEADVARRMLARPDTPRDALPRLELEIDLRMVGRWLNLQAAGAAFGSDLQVAARLRESLWSQATALLLEAVDRQGGRLTPLQAEAAARVHQLTFTLTENAKAVKDLDDVSRKLGLAMAAFLSIDEKLLVRMRPTPIRPQRDPGNGRPTVAADGPANLGLEVTRLNVSPQLRAQLLALLQAVSAARDGDAPLHQTFDVAMDLARGLQMNTGVDPADRQRMEHQLAEAVALFIDSRTRAIGAARLKDMNDYRTLLSRVRRLNLSPEQTAQLAPLIQWVNDNAEAGAGVLAALDRAGQCRVRFDARPKAPNALATLHRAVGELERQFTAAAAAFSRAAIDLPRSAATPADLEKQAAEMQRAVDLLERLDTMPATLEAMNAFQPRPAGALERRVTQLALAASNATASPVRTEATDALAELTRLERLVHDLSRIDVAGLSALQRRWTGGRLNALQAKWRSIVTEQLTALGAGQKMDGAQVARLRHALALLEAFRDGAAMDVALADAHEPLSRWVDWRLTVEDLKPVLLPYPVSLSEAYAGYVADVPVTMDVWTKVERRYRPLAQLIARDAAYGEPCAKLPTGAAGVAASLTTPLEGAPFATERFAGYAVWLWHNRHAAADLAGANEAINMLNRRLGE